MKIQQTSYTFNKTAKTITFTGTIPATLDKILAVVNVTAGVIIYNPSDTARGGTYSSPTLTLTYNTSAMNDIDKLLIYLEDGNSYYSTQSQLTIGTISSGTLQSAATGTGNGSNFAVSGYGTCIFGVTGTFVGTITFEGTIDGTNWFAINCTQMGANSIGSTATTTGLYRSTVSGLTTVRARVSSFVSGSITVAANAIIIEDPSKVIISIGQDIDNATQTSNIRPIPVGGKAVDVTSYAPAYTDGDAAQAVFDKISGALLVQQGVLSLGNDVVQAGAIYDVNVATSAITSTSTAFVNGTGIDMRGYNKISIFPNVTAAAGTNAFYRVQWSMDNTNWFDETLEADAAPGSGETAVTFATKIFSFASAATGFKSTSAVNLSKKGRYCRISQRSDASVTVTTSYNYQLA